jgi:hypothetical protein
MTNYFKSYDEYTKKKTAGTTKYVVWSRNELENINSVIAYSFS